MNLGLGGKAALITGGAGGIGSATARLFAQQGIAVALFDRDGEGAERVATELRSEGGTAIAGTMDVRDLDAFTAAVARTESELGGLDFIVSVAGGGTRQTLSTLSIEDWHAVIDLNLTGPFNAIKAGAPAPRRRGHRHRGLAGRPAHVDEQRRELHGGEGWRHRPHAACRL